MSLNCQHSEICAACPWMPMDYALQKKTKLETLKQSLQFLSLPEVQFISVGASSLRDRADLVVYQNGYGLYQKEARELFSVQECPQLSRELFAFYQSLAKETIPLKNPKAKGSLRLRVSPQGEKGLWLDFSNEDIQFLFEEKKTLHRLQALGYVEVGQRRKKLEWDPFDDRFRLKDPEFRPWTRTWAQDQEIPLYSVVGGFSQSSDHSNQLIIQKMTDLIHQSAKGSWLEFGCGNGNLTFPLASHADHVTALEFEGLAVEGLKISLDKNPSFKEKITLKLGNFQQALPQLFSQTPVSGVLVNPPRSGLKDFLKPLESIPREQRPKDFIYMSCFLESFSEDAKKMRALGYRLEEIAILDQFPQSPHFEILSRWVLTE